MAETQYTCALCSAVYRKAFQRCPRDGGLLAELVRDPLEGKVIAGRYEMEACIGEGAMGRVYRAHHARMAERRFAVKVMFGDLAADQKMRSRFEHEARALSLLAHPNVISVVDFGETEEGLLYLVMEFAEGRDLATILEKEGRRPEAEVLQIAKDVARGLDHAHQRGLIHRDLKAENILVVEAEGARTAKIVDFGIAKLAELDEQEAKLTAQGCVVGTPAYMSPEQACGEDIDPRSDLFSLGLILYELLSGKKPFDGTPIEIARKNVSADVPPIATRSPGTKVDPELERLVKRLLEKRRDQRPRSAADVLKALEALEQRGTPTPIALKTQPNLFSTESAVRAIERPFPVPIAATVGVAVALAAMFFWFRPEPKMVEIVPVPEAPPARVAIPETPPIPTPAPPAVEPPRPEPAALAKLEAEPAAKVEPPVKVEPPPTREEAAWARTSERGRKTERSARELNLRPTPKGEVTPAEFKRAYEDVGRALDRAVKKKGPRATRRALERYQSIVFLEAMRKRHVREEGMKKLDAIRQELARR